VLELDDQAQIISYEEYFPYGSSSYQAVRSATDTPKRYRYTGKERDGENDLYYHGARYYAPWLGRWTSCDPAGMADGLNQYNFVRGNPIILRDPSGTQGITPTEESERRSIPELHQAQTSTEAPSSRSPVVLPAVNNVLPSGEALPAGTAVLGPVPADHQAVYLKRSDFVPDDLGVVDNYEYYKSADCYEHESPTECEVLAKAAEARLRMFHIAVMAGSSPSFSQLAGAHEIISGASAIVPTATDAPDETLPPVLRASAPPAPTDQSASTVIVDDPELAALATQTGPEAVCEPGTAQTVTPPPVHEGAQGKHQIFHNNYLPAAGKSLLIEDPNSLAQSVGQGTQVGPVPRGQAGFKEQVNFNKHIGYSPMRQQPRWAVPTNEGIVHYNKNGEIHIVPTLRGQGGN
jgi:RHS repeat-associated protein